MFLNFISGILLNLTLRELIYHPASRWTERDFNLKNIELPCIMEYLIEFIQNLGVSATLKSREPFLGITPYPDSLVSERDPHRLQASRLSFQGRAMSNTNELAWS